MKRGNFNTEYFNTFQVSRIHNKLCIIKMCIIMSNLGHFQVNVTSDNYGLIIGINLSPTLYQCTSALRDRTLIGN